MKKIVRIVAFSTALLLLSGSVGCKKNPPKDSEYSVYYEYVDGNGNKTTDKKNTNTGSNKNESKDNNTGANDPGTQNENKDNNDNTSSRVKKGIYRDPRAKDLKGRNITYISWWNGIDRKSEAGRILTNVEKQLNCKLVERNMSNYQPVYSSILSGKPIADILCPKDDTVISMGGKGMLTPLNELSNFDFTNKKWNQGVVKVTSVNGKVYGMSRKIVLNGTLVYNKTMFKQNNWPDLYELQKKGQLTWDVLFDIMKKATAKGYYGLCPSYAIDSFTNTLLAANGVSAIKRIGDTKKFEYGLKGNPAATKALETIKDWRAYKDPNTKFSALYDTSNANWDSSGPTYLEGKAAMYVGGLSTADFDQGIVLFPHGPNSKQDLIVCHTNGIESIPSGVKEPNDVALFWDIFRDALAASDGSEDGMEDTLQPVKDKFPDASVAATLDRFKIEFNKGLYSYDYGSYNSEFKNAYKSVSLGEKTPNEAINSLEQVAKAFNTDFWK